MKTIKGSQIKANWVYMDEPHGFGNDVGRDFNEIDESDILLGLYPYATGSLCEISYAYGCGKYVGVLTDKMSFKDGYLPPSEYSQHFPLARAVNLDSEYYNKKVDKLIYTYDMNELLNWANKL